MSNTTIISGWGHFPLQRAQILYPAHEADVQHMVQRHEALLPRGLGKSYGDSSLAPVVLSMTGMQHIWHIDEEAATADVDAGVTLDTLLQHIVPKGLFFLVTPGIKSITVGGAVASDVHGKNHHQAGSFCHTVVRLRLVLPNGQATWCSPSENTELFYQAFGSMGLVGVVTRVVLQLQRIPSILLDRRQIPTYSIGEHLDAMEAGLSSPFMVSWIDVLYKRFRGVVQLANWHQPSASENLAHKYVSHRAWYKTIPFRLPVALPTTFHQMHNELYWRKALKEAEARVDYDHFFYPLDGIRNWHYAYGPRGMFQYHFRMPLGTEQQVLPEVLHWIRTDKPPCHLAVLKRFGPGHPKAQFSFPQEGYNLALDFAVHAGMQDCVSRLDAWVAACGGDIYRTKDAVSRLPKPMASGRFQSLQNLRYAG